MMDSLRTPEERKNYLSARSRRIKILNNNARYLDESRVKDCINKVNKSYEEATAIKYMLRIKEAQHIEDYRFRSIRFQHHIDRDIFLAKDYIWDFYFADVGRAIALGERKYLHRRIELFVEDFGESMYYEDLDFNLLHLGIRRLRNNNVNPNVMLMPNEVYADFLRHYRNEMRWDNSRLHPKLVVGGCELNVFRSNRHAPLKSIILFDSNAGTWFILKDEDTRRNLTVAIGASEKQSDKVEYLVETLAYYEVMNKKAYLKIKLLGERGKRLESGAF